MASNDSGLDQKSTEDAKANHKKSDDLSHKLLKVQAVTGLIISVFTSAHLINHFGMHFGLDVHRAMFRKFRKVYTHPIVESTLLLSIFAHGAVGLYRYSGLAKDWPRLLFQLSGYYLLSVMPIHVIATRYFGPKVGMAEYDITHAAMSARLLPIVFIPYYSLLAASGAIHMLGGIGRSGAALHIQELLAAPSKGAAYLKWSSILGALSVSSALAVMGVYFRYPMAEEALLITDTMSKWPRFISRFIRLPTGNEWFAGLTLNGN
jgi:succinate dehydrogenase hydrophobic anchor subunit